MRHIHKALILMLATIGTTPSWSGADRETASLRAEHLKRGVNISTWFTYMKFDHSLNRDNFLKRASADIDLVKRMGFDHVRLPVDPVPALALIEKSQVPDLTLLKAAVRLIIKEKLAVIVDIHPPGSFLKTLDSEESVKNLEKFWRILSEDLAREDVERVFLGILNEPTIAEVARWSNIQTRLAKTIRDNAPNHTLVATGPGYSSADELTRMEPLSDRNVIYDFHFYKPGVFTHQGASWALPFYEKLSGVRYPLDKESKAAVINQIKNTADLKKFESIYGDVVWDKTQIESMIKGVAEWARTKKVIVVCEEFGVMREKSLAADRVNWFQDVRGVLEKYKIGWAVWELEGGFGLLEPRGNQRVPDPQVLSALSLSFSP